MNALKQMRLKLGLTQQQVAGYLRVERSVIGMAEIGQREIPAAYQTRLSHLEQTALTVKVEPPLPTPDDEAAVARAMADYAAKQLRLAERLEQKLRALDDDKFKAHRTAAALAQMKALLPDASGDTVSDERLWIEVQERTLKPVDMAAHLFEKRRLQLRIDTLRYEAQRATAPPASCALACQVR